MGQNPEPRLTPKGLLCRLFRIANLGERLRLPTPTTNIHMRKQRAGGLNHLVAIETACRLRTVVATVLLVSFCGCSALHPLDGHDADDLCQTYRLPARTPQRTIDLSLLRQDPPQEHLVDAGDILGIYIEGVLDNPEKAPPVYIPNDTNGDPSLGFPIRVDTDGTISLPMLDPLPVRGLTIGQVRQLIRDSYTQGSQAVLQPGRDHIHVTLQKSRTYQVIVIREEAGNDQGNRGPAAVVNFETEKRGTGRVVNLPAHRNDVLNALTQTGGLPGLDAENVIYVIRGAQRQTDSRAADEVPTLQLQPQAAPISHSDVQQIAWKPDRSTAAAAPAGGHSVTHAHYTPDSQEQGRTDWVRPATHSGLQSIAWRYGSSGPASAPQPAPTNSQIVTFEESTIDANGQPVQEVSAATSASPMWPDGFCLAGPTSNIIRIPLKVLPGEPLSFRPEDVVLNDGDIVLVENRVTEFFYTAGLLGGGQYIIPRDYDIGIMDAIALAESQTRRVLPTASIGGASVLNQDVSVGASRVIVQRKMANGSYFPIEINLYDVMKDPSEQIMIRPEDRIILRYTRCEAMLACFERFFIDGIVTGTAGALAFGD